MAREESREDFEGRASNCRDLTKVCREAGDEKAVRLYEQALTTICGQAEEWASRNG
jgi:hypothetical protein